MDPDALSSISRETLGPLILEALFCRLADPKRKRTAADAQRAVHVLSLNKQQFSEFVRASRLSPAIRDVALGWSFVQRDDKTPSASFRLDWQSFCEALFSLANAAYTATAVDAQRPLRLLFERHIHPLCDDLGEANEDSLWRALFLNDAATRMVRHSNQM